MLLFIVAGCATRPAVPEPAPSLEEGIVGGKLEGFGLPEKQFLPTAQIPKKVLDKIVGAVRRLCVCRVAPRNCITVFSGTKDEFLTNEHALNLLAGMKKGDVANPDEIAPCVSEFVVHDMNGKTVPVKLSVLKRGKVGDRAHEVGQSRWYPAKYYSIKTEEYSDHRQDLALIRLKGITSKPLLAETDLKEGERVFHAGYSMHPRYAPYDQPYAAISDGRVIKITSKNIESDFLGVNGTSGGPVVNANGDLVGVFWGKERTWREEPFTYNVENKTKFFQKYGYPRERAFFVPVSAVIEFLK